jgi:cysteine desulfurase/selenocysteine lyase
MSEAIRAQFPILTQKVRDRKLHYLDSGNTSLKTRSVIDAVNAYNAEYTANVHRGTFYFSELATKRFEDVREKVRVLINAHSPHEIVFTKGTTDAINLVAHSFGGQILDANSEVLLTTMEHHSNIVPWQLICERTGAKIVVANIDENGALLLNDFKQKLNANTKIVGVTHVSNALGSVNDIKEITRLAHAVGAKVVVDGAQAIAHVPVDVQDFDCDFYAFSAHKMYGPTGVGVLYAKRALLDAMPPYQGGGDMIASVTFEKTTYAKVPYKFEAGTPNIAGVIGLGAAVDFLQSVGFDTITSHEDDLIAYAAERLSQIKGVRLIGTAPGKKAVVSFVMDGIHPHDVATIVDRQGVAIRAGHLCAQPVMKAFGVPALSRASFGVYSSREDVDALCDALLHALEVFA